MGLHRSFQVSRPKGGKPDQSKKSNALKSHTVSGQQGHPCREQHRGWLEYTGLDVGNFPQILNFHWLPDLPTRTAQLNTLLFTIKLSEIGITTSLDLLSLPPVCAWAWEPAGGHSRSLTLHTLCWSLSLCYKEDPAFCLKAFRCHLLQQGSLEIHTPQDRSESPTVCLVLPWKADVQRCCAFSIKVAVCLSQLDWYCFPSVLPPGS